MTDQDQKPNQDAHPICGAEGLRVLVANLSDTLHRSQSDLATLKGLIESHCGVVRGNFDSISDRTSRIRETVSVLSDKQQTSTEAMRSVAGVLEELVAQVETFQQALNDQTAHLQAEREAQGTCAMREFMIENGESDVIEGLARVAGMADRMDILLREILTSRGFDPETGKKREWLLVQVDRIRSSVSNIVVGAIAVGALTGFYWLWTTRQQVVSSGVNAVRLYEESEKSRQELMNEVSRLKQELEQKPKARVKGSN